MCIHKCHELRLRVTYCHELRCKVRYCQGLKCVRIHDTNSDVYPQMSRTQMCIHKCHELRCVREHVMNSAGIAVAMPPLPKYHEPNINATNSGVYQYMSRTQMCINTCHELRCVCIHDLKRHRSISRRSISLCVYVSRIYICIYKCDKLKRVCIHLTNSTGIAVSADPNFKIIDAAYPFVARRLLTGNDHPHTKKFNVFQKKKKKKTLSKNFFN